MNNRSRSAMSVLILGPLTVMGWGCAALEFSVDGQSKTPASSEQSATPSTGPNSEKQDAWQLEIAEWNQLLDQAEAELVACCETVDLLEQVHSTTLSTPFAKTLSRLKSLAAQYRNDHYKADLPETKACLARFGTLEEKIVEEMALPRNRFEGKELAELIAALEGHAQSASGKVVLGSTIVTPKLERFQRTEQQGLRLIKFDRANFQGYVALKGDGNRATIWHYYGYKDWLDKGKIKFDAVRPSQSGQMLERNLGEP